MLSTKKYLLLFGAYLLVSTSFLVLLTLWNNGQYQENSSRSQRRLSLLKRVHTSAPAIVTAGRNISFESGSAMANAPGSYINMLDCCEADEAIAERMLSTQIKATLTRKRE